MTYSKNSATNALTTAMITVMLLMGTGPFVRPFTTTSHKNSNLPSVKTAALGKKKTTKKSNTNPTSTPTSTPAPASTAPAPAPTPAVAPAAAAVKTVAKAPAKAAPAPAPSPVVTPGNYPWHHNITVTKFWAGEGADESNGFIQNFSSAWQESWYTFYGGVDDPNNRCGWNPCAFTPQENPFYFALPFGDYTSSGMKSNLNVIYWYTGPVSSGQTILKNRWIEISANGKTAYAQWEDVGPYNSDDANYVFGSAAPQHTVGLDLSPAADGYLGNNGYGKVSWRFVEASQVPAGPWKTTVTTSGTAW